MAHVIPNRVRFWLILGIAAAVAAGTTFYFLYQIGFLGTAADIDDPIIESPRERRIRERNALPTPTEIKSVKEAEGHVKLLGGRVIRNVLDLNRVFWIKLAGTNAKDQDLIVLSQLSNLKKLSLQDTLITGSGLKYTQGCKRLEVIFLDETAFSDEHLQHLSNLPALESLYLTHTLIDGSGFQHLTKCPKLTSLELDHSKIGSGPLNSLADLPLLENLSVKGTQFSDTTIASLKNSQTLKRLYLSQTPITDRGIEVIATIPNLVVLDLSATAITDQSIQRLAAACPKLFNLNISQTAITDDGIKALANCSSLKILQVAGTRITSDGLSELKKNPALLRLDIRGGENIATPLKAEPGSAEDSKIDRIAPGDLRE